jgi:hypothetical protein
VTENEIFETLQFLRTRAGFTKAYHVTEFLVHRETNRGHEEVAIRILDAGPDAQNTTRYRCQASSPEGEIVAGNPAETIDVALATVHWWKL